ncbi:hypothetical protein LXT21_39980 [Myxococcus sp. K38C18041901]|uniref:hypothetical protein n=1 Tax=Myxococcus guangdongensis TaxID=2906760 RepID=UPI0020A79197|nr:hypothetical protein [Myxococcus guangdongensis]MCP3064971.1 hypothetical protein [Myxococcus guangdongensis]
MKATARYAVLLSMLVVGCGSDSKGDGGDPDGGDTSFPETVECGDTRCKRATEYCGTIVTATTSHVCLKKKAGCNSCECVNLDTDLTAQTGRQDCSETASVNVSFTCAYYDDVDFIKTSCTVRGR